MTHRPGQPSRRRRYPLDASGARLRAERTAAEFGVRGPDRPGRILSRLPPRDPEAAESVSRGLLAFEEIARLTTEDLLRRAA